MGLGARCGAGRLDRQVADTVVAAQAVEAAAQRIAAGAAAVQGHQRDESTLGGRPHLAAASLVDRVDQTPGDVGQRLVEAGGAAAAQSIDCPVPGVDGVDHIPGRNALERDHVARVDQLGGGELQRVDLPARGCSVFDDADDVAVQRDQAELGRKLARVASGLGAQPELPADGDDVDLGTNGAGDHAAQFRCDALQHLGLGRDLAIAQQVCGKDLVDQLRAGQSVQPDLVADPEVARQVQPADLLDVGGRRLRAADRRAAACAPNGSG